MRRPQNAALVEQSAVTAETLEDQARSLSISVSHFNVGDQRDLAIKKSASPVKKLLALLVKTPIKPSKTSQIGNHDWEEF